jgi:hypothetical protein
VWRGGVWRGGVWRDGVWRDGVWRGGVWRDGVWRGGEWHDGEWHGGVWYDGEWHGGLWRDGRYVPRCAWRVTCEGDKIHIGCKTKTIPEWDAWFAGDEVFGTPRNTEAFKLIRANYEAVKAFAIWSTKETT